MREVRVRLSFDDRPRAKRAFEAALGCDEPLGPRLGHLGLARVQTLLGEFDGAHEHFRALQPIAPLDTAVHRIGYRLLSAQGRWDSVATALGDLCAVIPEGDYTRYLLNDRAAALYRGGQIAEARAAWETVATGKDFAAGTARRMLEKTARADAPARRLAAFPSVSQLRDHCGPASVELCLRFFGTAANQVDAKAGSIDDALTQLRTFADAQPKNAYVLVQWADIAYESNRPKDALEATGRLEKLDASHAASYAIGGAAACLDGRLEEGLEAMRKARELSPAYSWVYREMGRHLSEAGRHLEAITASAAHAGFNPNPWASFLLGRASPGVDTTSSRSIT